MRKALRIILPLIVLAGVLSCTERIDISLDEGTIRLVVDGVITTDTMAHRVILSKTTSYYYNQKAPEVTGAEVKITSGSGTIVLHEDSPGVYLTDPGYFGVEGETYILDIKLNTPVGGFTEYSAASVMSKPAKLDSLNLIFHPDWAEQGMWEVRGFFKDQPTTDFYRFLISRNGKMITDTIDEWFITDDRFFNGSYVNGTTVSVLDQGSADEKLDPGDEVTVELDCLDKNYAGFIWEAQAELRGSNPLFSGPPANVKGNISNGAIGFFAAYSSSRAKIKAEKK